MMRTERLITFRTTRQDPGARTHGRSAGPRNRVSKRGSEKRTAAEKREYSVITGPVVSPSPKDAG